MLLELDLALTSDWRQQRAVLPGHVSPRFTPEQQLVFPPDPDPKS